MPPFSIAPEDIDTDIETDDRVHDINTLFNRVHDMELQLQEKDQALHEKNEMLRKIDQALREGDQTIEMLLARERRCKWQKICVVQ
jgi:hypothetical protein